MNKNIDQRVLRSHRMKLIDDMRPALLGADIIRILVHRIRDVPNVTDDFKDRHFHGMSKYNHSSQSEPANFTDLLSCLQTIFEKSSTSTG